MARAQHFLSRMYYLDPGFEPKRLTKAELRSILASHNVPNIPHPSAKKEEILDVFYKEVIAKRNQILDKQRSIKPDSAGIVFLDEASRPSPKKSSSTPVKSGKPTTPKKALASFENLAPSTPQLVATYKLANRIEKIDGTRKTQAESRTFSSIVRLLAQLLGAAFLAIVIYLKFFYPWPVFTAVELQQMASKPILYLNCPFPPDSKVGFCEGGKLYCSTGYIERLNFLQFGKSCVIDRQRLSLLEAIKKRILLELEVRLGTSLCYANIEPSLNRNELSDAVSHYFKNLKPKSFAEYFDVSLKALLKEASIRTLSSPSSTESYLAKAPSLSVYCRVKLSAIKLIHERPLELLVGALIALGSFVLAARAFLARNRAIELQKYYLLICKVLKEQVHAIMRFQTFLTLKASNHHRDPTVQSFIPVNQIRDAVFMNESVRKKNYLWPRIVEKISKNSNIVESITTIRGEQCRAWEWIGADVTF